MGVDRVWYGLTWFKWWVMGMGCGWTEYIIDGSGLVLGWWDKSIGRGFLVLGFKFRDLVNLGTKCV